MNSGRPRLIPPDTRRAIADAYLNAPMRLGHRGRKRHRDTSYWKVARQFGVAERTVMRCVAEARGYP